MTIRNIRRIGVVSVLSLVLHGSSYTADLCAGEELDCCFRDFDCSQQPCGISGKSVICRVLGPESYVEGTSWSLSCSGPNAAACRTDCACCCITLYLNGNFLTRQCSTGACQQGISCDCLIPSYLKNPYVRSFLPSGMSSGTDSIQWPVESVSRDAIVITDPEIPMSITKAVYSVAKSGGFLTNVQFEAVSHDPEDLVAYLIGIEVEWEDGERTVRHIQVDSFLGHHHFIQGEKLSAPEVETLIASDTPLREVKVYVAYAEYLDGRLHGRNASVVAKRLDSYRNEALSTYMRILSRLRFEGNSEPKLRQVLDDFPSGTTSRAERDAIQHVRAALAMGYDTALRVLTEAPSPARRQ